MILHYLADHFGKFQGEDKLEVLRWMLWDNHKLTSYIATLRFFVQFQKSGETPVTEFLRGRVKGSLGILDKHLEKQRLRRGQGALDRRLLDVRLPVLARRIRRIVGRVTRASARGSSASARCPAGCIPTS